MRNLTTTDFHAQWPHAPVELVTGIITTQGDLYPKYGITRAIRLAHLWAQLSWESGAGLELFENMNYSAGRLLQVFGVGVHSAKVTASEASALAHHPDKIAERVYGLGNPKKAKELGNIEPGDGWKYRGRGLIQTTGRNGYAALAKATGLPLIEHPEMVADPLHALHCALAEFEKYPGILTACDQDNIAKVTRLINGGVNGLTERTQWLARWKKQLNFVS